MPKFRSMVDIGLLYKRVEQGEEHHRLVKLMQNCNLTTIERRIMSEAMEKTHILQEIIIGISKGEFTKDDAENVLPPMIMWAKENIRKATESKAKKSIIRIKKLARNLLNRFKHIDKLAKAGKSGRSGRQKGYRFDPTKHPRGSGGKFKSKGQAGATGKVGPRVTETGKQLPSYDIVGGERVGRGIQRVPKRFGPAAARIAGHAVSGAFSRATGEPVKAASMATKQVRSKHRREKAIKEALHRELQSPKTSASEKKKIINTLKEMGTRRKRTTGRPKLTTIGGTLEQLKAGAAAGTKSLPYSLTVGVVQGALKGLVERFRTHPILAPLDIRIRPDIMESGLRTVVAHLKDKRIERVFEIVNSAKDAGRILSVEEYGQITSLLKLSPKERKSIVSMAEGLNDITERPNPSPQDLINAVRIERQIDESIGDYLAGPVKAKLEAAQPYTPAPAKRQVARTKAKANIPAVELTPEKIARAEELMIRMKSKKGDK